MQNRWPKFLFLGALSLSLTQPVDASPTQDTVRLTLPMAEQRFIDSNLALLASRYSIDIAKAELITARLYNNPELTFENVLYNPDNKKIVDFSYQGGTALQLTQVITLAGKRNKAIRLARSGVQLAEYEFYDLVRTLSFTLRDEYFKLVFSRQSYQLFGAQIEGLQKILTVSQQQMQKGNISASEVLRIQSLLYNLQSEQHALQQNMNETVTNLRTLVRIDPSSFVIPEWQESTRQATPLTHLSYEQLLDSARAHRYDLLGAREQVRYQELNERLQKAMAVPDLTVGLTYDKQGNFTRNYNGLQLSMPLPIFNRNQGHIAQAGSMVAQSKTQLKQTEESLSQEMMQRYTDALNAEKLFRGIDPEFHSRFSKLIDEVQKNFIKRNISLLEFIDLYNSYKESITGLNNIRYERYRSLEYINYTAGVQLIHF